MRRSALVTVLCVTLGTLTLPAPAAHADVTEPVVVQLDEAWGVAADPKTQQVFVSTGPRDTIEVFDWDGEPVATIADVDNPVELVLDADHDTVWATLPTTNRLAAIDTVSRTVTTYYLPDGTEISSAAVIDGTVFFVYGPTWDRRVGMLDPESVDPALEPVDTEWDVERLVTAGDVLYVFAAAGVWASRVADGVLTPIVSRTSGISAEGTASASDDGRELLQIAEWGPVLARDGETLDPMYTYSTAGGKPTGGDYSDDSSLLAVTTEYQSSHVLMYYRGSTQAAAEWSIGDAEPGFQFRPGQITFGGRDRVFAVAESFDHSFLVVVPVAPKANPIMSVTAPASSMIGDTITVSGQVLAPGADLAGQQVSLRRVHDNTATTLGTVELDAEGSFQLDDQPPAFGTYRYLARWAGDDVYAPRSGQAELHEVRRLPSALTVEIDHGELRSGDSIVVTVRLGHEDRTPYSIDIYRKSRYWTKERVFSDAIARRKLVREIPLQNSGRILVEYDGNDTYAPATFRSPHIGVLARVESTVGGYFRRDGDTWLVRTEVDPAVNWTVYPNPIGQSAVTVLQARTSDGWRTLRRSAPKDAAAQLTRVFSEPRSDGTQWRVRLLAEATPFHKRIVSDWTHIAFRGMPAKKPI